jgi:hypothetical protein
LYAFDTLYFLVNAFLLESSDTANTVPSSSDKRTFCFTGNEWEGIPDHKSPWATLNCSCVLISDMAENIDGSREFRLHFGLGFFEGFFAGIAAAILVRAMTSGKSDPSRVSNGAGSPISSFREHGSELQLKRKSGEHAGDPSQLVTVSADQAKPQFERPGGAPGPNGKGEVLERPGYPGQILPKRDASKPIQPVSRIIDMK